MQLGLGQDRGGPCQRRPTRAGRRHDLWAPSQASALNSISFLNPVKHTTINPDLRGVRLLKYQSQIFISSQVLYLLQLERVFNLE